MITDYASLVAAVIDHTARDDVESAIPRAIQLSEAIMQRRLRTLDMETTVTPTVSGGEYLLPADLVSIRSVRSGDDELIDQTRQRWPVEPFLAALSTYYSRAEGSLILSPTPDEDVELTISYIARFTPLSETNDNWILRDHPDIYFYGTLAQVYAQWRDNDAPRYAQLFAGALDDLAQSRARDKWGSGISLPTGIRQVAGARI